MDPGRYDIKLIRGITFKRSFRWTTGEEKTPVDLTGYSVETKLDPRGSATLVTGTATIQTPQNDALKKGYIDVVYDNSLTTLLAWEEGEWFLNVTDPGGEPARLVEGLVKVRD